MISVLRKGFTLVELLVVLIFIGILAALVVPRYLTLHSHAVVSELTGVVGSVESGSAQNFAGYTTSGTFRGRAVRANDDCAAVAIPAALPSGLPEAYTVHGEKVMAYTGDHYGTCTITHEKTGKAQNAVIMLTRQAK